jgi:hypothetical protein
MRRVALIIGASLLWAGAAHAIDGRFERSLRKLAPVDRLEQLCDYEAMQRIRQEHRPFRPDRAVAGAEKQPSISADTIVVKGGAFRSRKKWYALTYNCTAAPDHLKVTSFSYAIGAEIPEDKWASYGLWE